MNIDLKKIADRFQFQGAVSEVRNLGEGFVNDTFIVETNGGPRYILQRKNKRIFKDVPAMMDNILRVTQHLKRKIAESGGDPLRESLTVIPTKEGPLFYQDETGEYWAACLFIEDTVTHDVARTPELAYQGGKGIGQFQAMLSDFHEPLTDILPGFHNMRFRFEQWDATLAKDPAGRKAGMSEEIAWVENRRAEMLRFWAKVESGEIPTRVTHNDTKLSNILFDKQGNILCVIDLDTVLSSTCLNDYGDAMRSYSNTAVEDEPDYSKITMNIDIFCAYTEGYLSQTHGFLTPAELDNLAFSAKYITFEQVLRFLMDYLDGDQYYRIHYPEHNKVRTQAQYTLLQSMERQYDDMCRIVKETAAKYK